MHSDPPKTQSNSGFSFDNALLRSHKYTSYFEVYDKVLKPFLGKPITLLEIGVLNGGGLMMWRSLLGNEAHIIGVDLNPQAKQFEKFGFEICIGDQSDTRFWKNFLENHKEIDIVIDDGGHTNYQQINSLVNLIPNMNKGGVYIIEDLHCSYLPIFGNPSRWSTLNFLISGIDGINSRSPLLKSKNNFFSSRALSITFFESIGVIELLREVKLDIKSIKNTGVKSVHKDFRLEGLNSFFPFLGVEREIEHNLISKFRNRLRTVLQVLALRIQNKSVRNLFKQSRL